MDKTFQQPLLVEIPGTKESTISAQEEPESKGNSWFSSMVIIIANVMGIGVLGLAHAFAKLGWIFGVLTLIIAMGSSVYSGLLLSRMKLKIPSATIYADLGQAAYGNLGGACVTIFAYTYIIGICFSFQLSASLALKELTNGLCFVYCALIVAGIILPLAQYRNFEELTSFVYVGAMAIVVPILVIISEVALQGQYDYAATTLINASSSFEATMVACMNVLFAISGQVIFIEIMAEMSAPSDFPKSIYGSSAVFAVVYTTMACLGYGYIGSSVLNPITDNLTDAVAKRWCAAFILTHIIIAYVMQVIVLARGFEHIVLHQIVHEDSKHASYRDRIVWFLVTLLIVVVGFMVCNITPFINSLMGFVGAISGVTTTYVFPFLFAPVLLRDEMSDSAVLYHRVFGVVAMILAIVGVYASVHQMQQTFMFKVPFAC